MSVELFVVFVALAVFFAVFQGWRSRAKRQASWSRLARELGLVFHEGSLFEKPSMSGRHSGLVVRVEVEQRGSGSSSHPVTRFAASFRAPLPEGLRIAKQGFGDSIKILFGGQDIEVGIRGLDPVLRIQAEDPEAARKWVRRRGVDRRLLAFLQENEEALIADRSAQLVLGGIVTDPEAFRTALGTVTSVVRRLEEGDRWNPGDEEPFLPRPKLLAKAPAESRAPASAGGEAEGIPPPPLPSSGTVDALVASLESQGLAEGEGQFTLDREVAKERMREVRLARPERYVVSLLQAARCKGARKLVAQVGGGEVVLRFDGRPFTRQDFEELYGSLFAGQRDPEARARQHLALGVSAALGLEPRSVEVRSGDGRSGTLLRLAPGKPDVIEPLEDPPPADTRIHVKHGLGEFLKGHLAEVEAALCEAGRYARLDLRVNEESVAWGFQPLRTEGQVPLAREGFEGFCAFDPELEDRAELRFVLDGAWISTETLAAGLPGFVAVVESDRLRADLSAGAVVHDAAWEEALAAVAEAEGRVLEALGQEIERKRRLADPHGWAVSTLRAAHLRYDRWEEFASGGEAHALARLAVWPVVQGDPMPLWTLMQACEKEGRLVYSHASLDGLGLSGVPRGLSFEPTHALAVGWLGPSERSFLAHLFGDRLESGVEELLGE